MEKPPTMETIIVWRTFFHTMSMYCTTNKSTIEYALINMIVEVHLQSINQQMRKILEYWTKFLILPPKSSIQNKVEDDVSSDDACNYEAIIWWSIRHTIYRESSPNAHDRTRKK